MNDRQIRALDSYRRILASLLPAATSLPSEALAVVERLKLTVHDITTNGYEQRFVRMQHSVTSARSKLERMRQEEMLPLARLARRVFAGEPDIQAALRVPHKRAPTEAMLAASARMVRTLRPHRALLAASHVDPARIDRLLRETRRLKKIFEVAYASLADRAAPTRRLPELFASAHADVLVLDALVAANPTMFIALAWKRTRRVGKRIGRPRARRRARLDATRVA
jgi:hypothetical protein